MADIDPATAGAIARVVQPLLAVSQLLMISRIVLSWYPQVGAARTTPGLRSQQRSDPVAEADMSAFFGAIHGAITNLFPPVHRHFHRQTLLMYQRSSCRALNLTLPEGALQHCSVALIFPPHIQSAAARCNRREDMLGFGGRDDYGI